MVNTCGEIEHCTPCTEATPSREGVASLGGEWREAGEEGGRASSLPPSLPPWVVGELLGVIAIFGCREVGDIKQNAS